MSDTATNHHSPDNTTQKPTLDDNDHTTIEPNNEPPLSPLNPNSPPSSPTAADVGAPQSTDPPLPSADEEQHSNSNNNGNEQPSIQKVENDEQQQPTTTTNTNDNESTIATTTTTTEATTTVAEATTSSNNNNEQEEEKVVAHKEETEAEAEQQQQQDTNTSSSSNATPRDVLTRSVRFSEVITVRQETIVTESSVLGTIRDTIGKKVNKRRNSLKQASSSPSSSSSSSQQPSPSSPQQSTTTAADDEKTNVEPNNSNNSSSHQPHSVTTVTVVEETETNPELSEANQQQQQQQQQSSTAATTTPTTEQQQPQETPSTSTTTTTTIAATTPTNEVNNTTTETIETTETTETIVNENNENNEKTTAEKTENGDLYMGKKQRSTASFRYRKTSGHYRFNENSPIIQNLFKQNNDQILLFNAEVVQVNSKMKQHKRILIVSEKFLYTLNVRNYKLKRMVSLDMISQLTVSELNDNFLFLHVSGAPGFIFRTDKKTEVITVLENVITEADARELPLVVSNEFKFAHWKYEEMLSVSFQYGDLSHSRAVNNAVIEAHKDRISFKIHHVSSSECKLESIFLDMVDSDNDTPEKDQRIEVTTSSEVIPISSSVSEYSMFIRFHITENIEGAFVEEKIETASGNQVWVTKLGNLNLEAEQKIRSFDVKIENRKIKSSRLSDTIVSVRLVDEKKRVLFDSRFTYAVQSKRGKRVAALSKLFSRFA